MHPRTLSKRVSNKLATCFCAGVIGFPEFTRRLSKFDAPRRNNSVKPRRWVSPQPCISFLNKILQGLHFKFVFP